MSAYVEVKSVLTDEEYLLKALRQMGYQPQVHHTQIMLTDDHGHSRPAHIVIPKEQLDGAYAAIGFYLNPQTGQYDVVIDQDDQRGYSAFGRRNERTYAQDWLGEIEQLYMEHHSMAVAEQEGMIFEGRSVASDGTIELKFFSPE